MLMCFSFLASFPLCNFLFLPLLWSDNALSGALQVQLPDSGSRNAVLTSDTVLCDVLLSFQHAHWGSEAGNKINISGKKEKPCHKCLFELKIKKITGCRTCRRVRWSVMGYFAQNYDVILKFWSWRNPEVTSQQETTQVNETTACNVTSAMTILHNKTNLQTSQQCFGKHHLDDNTWPRISQNNKNEWQATTSFLQMLGHTTFSLCESREIQPVLKQVCTVIPCSCTWEVFAADGNLPDIQFLYSD